MATICSKCGVALDPTQGFCNHCGTAGNTAQAAPVTGGGALKPILIAVGILLVAGMGAGGWLYARNHDKPVPPVEAKQAKAVTGGAPTSSSDAASKMKACSLVTKEEMEQILGAKLKDLAVDQLTCQYRNDEGYMVELETTWEGGKEAMASAKIYNASLFDPVPELGDEAYFQAAGVMHVRKGDVYMIINSRIYQNPRETETLIAAKALARLAR
jgi:hypothetical protein